MAIRHLAALATSATLLAGCGQNAYNAIGSSVDPGDFGNSTMNNTLVMTGQRDATYALQGRFANEVPSTITFAFNSAALTPEAQRILDQQAGWIRQFPELRFRVYGHTDLVGSDGYNKALGKRRAEAVVAYFASRGISRSRLEALVSFGETQPVVQTASPEERNRRTVTEVSGWVQSRPGELDGKYAQVIFREYVKSALPVPIIEEANAESQ
jgi:outer membrane protein OmpA-like peptidoglycan-associated protein